MNRRVLGGFCALAALFLDQSTKALALNTPELERGVEILPFLNLVRVLNDGVSFGLLGGIVPWWGLVALATVALVACAGPGSSNNVHSPGRNNSTFKKNCISWNLPSGRPTRFNFYST